MKIHIGGNAANPDQRTMAIGDGNRGVKDAGFFGIPLVFPCFLLRLGVWVKKGRTHTRTIYGFPLGMGMGTGMAEKLCPRLFYSRRSRKTGKQMNGGSQ